LFTFLNADVKCVHIKPLFDILVVFLKKWTYIKKDTSIINKWNM